MEDLATILGISLTLWFFWRAVVLEDRLNQVQVKLSITESLLEKTRADRRLLEEIMRESFSRLQKEQHQRYLQVHSLATLGKLATSILHDIANPVSYATLIAEQVELSGGREKRTALVLRGLRQISFMIDSVRKQLQHQEKPCYFSVNTEIRRAKLFLQHRWKERGLQIELELESGLRCFGDKCRLYQCISNLMLNAIEAYDDTFLPKNRKHITVTSRKTRNSLILTVQDRAIGIPNQLRRHVFTPLFTTKSPTNGLGIGLAWTREIVQQTFRGSIKFSSTEGAGTIFTVCFPISCKT